MRRIQHIIELLGQSPFKGAGAALVESLRALYVDFLATVCMRPATLRSSAHTVLLLCPESPTSFFAPEARMTSLTALMDSTDTDACVSVGRLTMAWSRDRNPHAGHRGLRAALAARLLGEGAVPTITIALIHRQREV